MEAETPNHGDLFVQAIVKKEPVGGYVDDGFVVCRCDENHYDYGDELALLTVEENSPEAEKLLRDMVAAYNQLGREGA
jgi:hypothetical protein